MKYLRIIVINALLLGFISFLGFAPIYMYKTNQEAREIMQRSSKHPIKYDQMVKSSIKNFSALLIITYSFYFFIFLFLFKQKISKRNIIYSIGIFLFLFLVIGFIDSGKIDLKFKHILSRSTFIFIIGGIGLGTRALIEYFNDKEKRKELERKNLQSELNLLRTQINPHFLFNTLNNIDAQIRKDPEKASELLIKLSEEMRYMLYDSNTEKISIISEIEFIRNYISLQKVRVKNPGFVELKLSGNFENIQMPPMLFIPFIENAFKHCNKPNLNNAIVFSLEVNNKVLTFASVNYYEPEGTNNLNKVGGIGLDLVKKRLDLIYPRKHSLNITKTENQFIVSLTIQIDAN